MGPSAEIRDTSNDGGFYQHLGAILRKGSEAFYCHSLRRSTSTSRELRGRIVRETQSLVAQTDATNAVHTTRVGSTFTVDS